MKPVLTEKQKRFIDYYVETGNATEAARKAGYSEKTSYSIGHENLKKPEIKSAIDARLKELEEMRVADAREVLIHLTAAMRGEIVEYVPVVEGMGDGVSRARLLEKPLSAHDRLEAAKSLMKRYGLMMSDLEQEEKRARIDAIRKDMNDRNAEEKVVIVDDISGEDCAE